MKSKTDIEKTLSGYYKTPIVWDFVYELVFSAVIPLKE